MGSLWTIQDNFLFTYIYSTVCGMPVEIYKIIPCLYIFILQFVGSLWTIQDNPLFIYIYSIVRGMPVDNTR